jgi:predicted ATPase
MITQIRIQNFKCFEDTGDIDIRPLTIFIGPNSSGKSSIIKMLLLLKQTIESTDQKNPLITNGDWVEVGAYSDFIYKGEIDRNLEISLKFKQNNSNFALYSLDEIPSEFTLNTSFSYNPSTTQIKLDRTYLSSKKSSFKIEKQYRKKYYAANVSYYSEKEKKMVDTKFEKVEPLKFYGYFPIKTKNKRAKPSDLLSLTSVRDFDLHFNFNWFQAFDFQENLVKEIKNLFYLGPMRDYPQRIYIPTGEVPEDVGITGDRAVDTLWISKRSKVKSLKNIDEETKKWFAAFEFSKDIKLHKLSKDSVFYEVLVTNKSTGFDTNFADVGFGVAQTLPIIIECFYSPDNSLLLIEQPEIHLHPKAQATLGDFFIESIIDHNKTCIIETHSEHLISRIRRRIAEKRLNKEDVRIYYFEPTIDGTKVREIKLNDQGQFISFPDGFFQEDIDETFAFLNAIRTSKQNC